VKNINQGLKGIKMRKNLYSNYRLIIRSSERDLYNFKVKF